MAAKEHNAYTVGWICALESELIAARALLDQEHEQLPAAPHDDNNYIVGQMGGHYVVIACTEGVGLHKASRAANNMVHTFPNIRFGLMVGVGGGVPKSRPDSEDSMNDIRLGDVVVCEPRGGHGGVLQYDMGKEKEVEGFQVESHLNKPPAVLLTAMRKLKADHAFELGQMGNYIAQVSLKAERLRALRRYRFPGWEYDRLYASSYYHIGAEGSDCSECDPGQLVQRLDREFDGPAVHYGLIASGNRTMSSAQERDRIRDSWDVCCFEMGAAGVMDNFPCVVIRGICDYSDSHKTKAWQPYAAVTAAAYAKDLLRVVRPQRVEETQTAAALLREFSNTLDRVDHGIAKVAASMGEHQRSKILAWLHPYDFGSEQSDVLRKAQHGTGKWLLDSSEFQQWLKGEKQSLLCQGIPGAGKTVMTSIIVNHLSRIYQDESDIKISYLYCNFRRKYEQAPADLLALLLAQLAWQQEELPQCLFELYDFHKKKKTRPSIGEISSTLRVIISGNRRAYVAIDALDEYMLSRGDRSKLLDHIFGLQRVCALSIFATSRFSTEIEDIFKRHRAAFLEIRAKDADIRRYIQGNVSLLLPFAVRDATLTSEIETRVIEAADGMFLLAKLHLDSLQDKITPAKLKSALSSLARGSGAYEEVYHGAMERISSQMDGFRSLAMRSLSWVVHAMRPLTPRELQHALSVEGSAGELDKDNIVDIELATSVCAGLLTVDEKSNIIRLVHYTGQEYFEAAGAHWFPTAHRDITVDCLNYLSFDILGPDFDPGNKESMSRLRDYALHDYAAKNWGHHAKIQPAEDSLVIGFLKDKSALETWAQVIPAMKKECECYCVRKTVAATGLHAAAFFGMEGKVGQLIQDGDSPNAQDALERTPLAYAASKGYGDVVRILLDQGADPNIWDHWGMIPLAHAAENGQDEVINILLEYTTKGEKRNRAYGIIFVCAARTHNHQLLKFVPEDTDLREFRNIRGHSLLGVAAAYRNRAMVELLLEKGHDPNIKNIPGKLPLQTRSGDTPLIAAAKGGDLSIVQLLLQHGADYTQADSEGRDALVWAAESSHDHIVDHLQRQLLSNPPASLGRDIDDQSAVNDLERDRITAEKLVASTLEKHGVTDGVKLLSMMIHSTLGAKDARLTSAHSGLLFYCARTGLVPFAKLLLEHGVPANCLDQQWGRTPVSQAAEYGHDGMVELLLDFGVDPNSRDSNGTHPSQNNQGRTPLMWAAMNGHPRVVELLLARGADPSIEERDGRQPLSWAAEHGRPRVVKLFLDRDVEINRKDRFQGQTPLSWASMNGHEKIVNILLDHGADASIPDDNGKTALLWAQQYGHQNVKAALFSAMEALDEDLV